MSTGSLSNMAKLVGDGEAKMSTSQSVRKTAYALRSESLENAGGVPNVSISTDKCMCTLKKQNNIYLYLI